MAHRQLPPGNLPLSGTGLRQDCENPGRARKTVPHKKTGWTDQQSIHPAQTGFNYRFDDSLQAVAASASRLRVRFGSTEMPGPIVVVKLTRLR